MKPKWIHPRKRQAFVGCLTACAYLLLLCWVWWFMPDAKSGWMICFMSMAVIIACYFGYRAFFFSNDWFRAKQDKEAAWWDKHPRLGMLANSVTWAVLVYFLVQMIWRFIQKH